MKPKRTNPLFARFFAAGLTSLIVVSSAAYAADSISINFGAGNAVSEAGKITGAIPIDGALWNNPVGKDGTDVAVTADSGPGATATWTSNNLYFSGSSGSTLTSENGDLTKNYLDDSAGVPITVKSPYLLNNIYLIPATDGGGTYPGYLINGAYYKGDGVGATIPSTGPADGWTGAPWIAADAMVEGVNYVKVASQTGVSILSTRSGSNRGSIAGVQVVDAYTGTLSYWDVDGNIPGAGGAGAVGDLDGTWGTDAFWSTSADGDVDTAAWTPGNAAVFSAGSAIEDANEITLNGTQVADAVWVQEGEITLTGGTLDLSAGLGLLRGDDLGLIVNSDVTAANLTTAGTVTLGSASNTITGVATINGTVYLGANHSFPQIAGGGSLDVSGTFACTIGATDLDSTFNGNFLGSGVVTKAGTGNLTLTSGSPGFSGTLDIAGGTLTYSNAKGAYNAAIALTGAGSLVFEGSGTSDPTITVTGNNAGFSGPVAIDGARVTVDSSDDLGSGGVTVLNGGQLFAIGGGSIATNVFINGTGTSEGAGNLGAVRLDGGTVLSGTVTLQSNARLTAWAGTTGTVSGALVGASDLETTGTGTLIIASTANTGFTGKVISNSGILRLADQTSIGSTPGSPLADSITLQNGGRIQGGTAAAGNDLTLDANRGITLSSGSGGFHVWTGFTMSVGGAITGPGNLTKSDGGTLVVNGNTGIGGSLTANSGTQTFNGDLILGGSFGVGTNIVTNLNCPTFSAGVAGTDGMKFWTGTTNINIGTGTAADLEMGNAGGQAHTINHTAGDLTINKDARIGHWGSETSVYNISGGSLNLPDTVTNTGAEDQANLMLGIDGSGILNSSGTGVVNTSSLVVNGRNDGSNGGQDALNLTGGRLNLGKWGMRTHGTTYAVNLGGGTVGASTDWSSGLNMTLTGTGGNTIFNTLDSVDALTERTITLTGTLSGSGGLVKQGAGTLNLSNENNAFTGTTQVDEGTLFVRNNAATPINSLILSGGILNPGGLGASAAVNAVSTEFDGGTARFRIGSGVDRVNTTDFTVTSATVIEVSPVGDLVVGAEYPVVDYSGTLTGYGNLSLTPLPNPRYGISLVNDVANTAVNVKVDVIDSLIWTGAAGTTWNDTDVSWKLVSNGSPATFLPLDKVLFDGATPGTITLEGVLAAGQVAVATALDYEFAGSGGLAGNASILKTGTGTLTLNNSNGHLGGNSINDGLLVAADPSALGGAGNITQIGASGTLDLGGMNLESTGQVIKSAGTISNSSATRAFVNSLELTGNTTLALDNAVTVGAYNSSTGSLNLGGNTLIKTGPGKLVLNGVSVTSGNITINEGAVQLITEYGGPQRDVSLTSTGNLTINPGGSLTTQRWGAGLTITMPIVLNGGTFGSSWPGPNGATIAAPINVTANSFFNFGGGYGNVTFSGVISGTGKITRTGGETVYLTGDNTTSGGFAINAGNLQVGKAGTTGTLGSGPVTVNSTLIFDRSDNFTVANAIGGTGQIIKRGGETMTLTGINTYTGNTTVEVGALDLADGAQLSFAPMANGVSNKITGAGVVFLSGDFSINTSGTDITDGNSWLLVDRAALTLETFASTFGLVGFTETGNIHTRVEGGKTWTFTEATGVLSLAVAASGYDTWADTNAPTGTAADDYDGDGVSNGVEYVLGGLATTNDLGKLPTVAATGGNLTFTFFRDQDSKTPDTSVTIEVGTTLLTWPDVYTVPATGVLGPVTVTDNLDGTDKVTLTVTMTPDAKKFARLSVVVD